MRDIGLIGVGFIGKLFVDRLEDTDHSLTVFDIDDSQIEYATERGAAAAASPREVTERSDVVVMALPGTPEVEATMEGEDGILAALEEDQLVIDVTTTLPETSAEVDLLCEEHGAAFVEAPITGGSPQEGWHMMIGGTEAAYDEASDVLDALCDYHTRIGEVGDAIVFKLALQMRYAGHHALDAEIVEFLRDNDVDPEPLNGFLQMDVWEKYFTGDFSQEIEGLGGLAIWHKDLGYARQYARDQNTALPLIGDVHEAYKATVRRAGEDEGHASALIKYWQALNDAENR